jgi:hypothetical protein
VSQLPLEAREGLMRAWLKVLHDRHPQVTWVPVSHEPVTTGEPTAIVAQRDELAESA